MTTLTTIESAGKKLASYQRIHGKSAELDKAIAHLRIAYDIVKKNGGK